MSKNRNHDADIENPNNELFVSNNNNKSNQLNPNNEEFKSCNPPKDVRKFIDDKQKEYRKPIEEIIPIIQKKLAKEGKSIKKGSLLAKTQSEIDKCKKKTEN